MNMFNHNEDIQYFREVANIIPIGRKTYCETTIRLLSQANEIVVPLKKKESKSN